MYLNAHSYYSFKYGTLSPETLLQCAKDNDYDSLALTDINNSAASLNFIRLAAKIGIKPLVGIEFRNKNEVLYVGLAKNNNGFRELNEFLTLYLANNALFPLRAPGLENVFFIYPLKNSKISNLSEHEFIGIAYRDLNKLRLPEYSVMMKRMLVFQTFTFRNQKDFNAHRILRAIDNNTILSKLPKNEEANPDELLIPQNQLYANFVDYPQLIENTKYLIDSCNVSFDFGSEATPKNLQTYTGSRQKDVQLLKHLCEKGLSQRYTLIDEAIQQRLHKELDLIQRKNFVSYFLINWDIVSYARQKGYFYVGRGSGANSIVAYLLRITDVDPIEIDLYFERFINLYRQNPPDFDIDFSWKDRDDVIAYIFNRFPHTALLATYNTFQYKAAVREIGKVFGLPKHEIDLLSDGKFDMSKLDSLSQLVLKYAAYLQDFPSHLSIHAGGVLISDEPISNYSATFMPPKGFATVQFDMIIAEDAGLYKFDILSQRGLGKIKDAIDIIRQNQPEANLCDIHQINRFKNDEKVKQLLRTGKTMGCFYIESPAMRMLLSKLEVDHYLGLVAASSIIRPGVAKSGMMKEYILRYRNPERRQAANPIMLEIMPETYGVMVYQEDVIKVAHYFAGLSLGEADVLRRGMSGKFRSREEFNQVKSAFHQKALEKGHDERLIAEIWRQIESFAGYAFAKGHSASYAVESYQCLYLKAYFPLEYMVAVLNNFGGFYYPEHYVHEAAMLGANIHAPCVNKSQYLACIYGIDIYLGFILLKDLEINTAECLIKERNQYGSFIDFDDFIERVPVSMEQLTILIRIDAFRFTGKNKRELMWMAHLKLNKQMPSFSQTKLFHSPKKNYQLPELQVTDIENAYEQRELLGFSLHNPFQLVESDGAISMLSNDLKQNIGKVIQISGYLVSVKRTRTSNGMTMYFGTFIDSQGFFFDTVHFPQVAITYRFQGSGVYKIKGKVSEEFDFCSVEVVEMHKLKPLPLPH